MTDRIARLSRRAALALPLGLAGCGLFDDWFGENKTPLPGKRVSVLAPRRGLSVDANAPKVVLPPPAVNTAWPEPGGNPAHDQGHPALGDAIKPAWSGSIGDGAGYRDKITATPVVADGRLYTMDSDAVVSAFDLRAANRLWRFETQRDEDDNTNVGGGLSFDGGTLYVSTGRGDLIALDAATAKPKWRIRLPNAARSAPTIVEGRLFVSVLGDQTLAYSAKDGSRLWNYQAADVATSILGLPAPAYVDGIVVAGFGSGDLVGLRADTGAVAWSDSLASARGRNSLVDLSSIRGLPVVSGNTVVAVGIGGLMLALDLRTGRRIWERDVASVETPWVAGDWVFVLSTDNHLAAISRTEGLVAWVTELPAFENAEKKEDPISWTSPVLAGDRLVLGGSNETAISVSPYTGAILGTQKLSSAAALGAVVADSTLFIVTDDGKVTAYR